MIRWILEGSYLLRCVHSDLKTKQISLRWSKWMLAAGVLLRLPEMVSISAGLSIGFLAGLFLDALPGIVCILFSCLSKGKMGMGDGLMILVTGIFLGAEKTVQITWRAFLFGACYAAALLLKGKSRQQEFAFAPCLFLAFLTIVLGTALDR